MKANRRDTLALLAALASGLAGCTDSGTGNIPAQTTTEEPTRGTTQVTTKRETPTPEQTPGPTFEDLPVPKFPVIDPVTTPSVERDALAAQIRGNVGFMLGLFDVLRTESSTNLFFSPYSVSTALAMTWAGARTETEATMADALQFELNQKLLHSAFGALDTEFERRNEDGRKTGTPMQEGTSIDPAFELSIANALWGQTDYPFREPFVELVATNYDAGVASLNFASKPKKARTRINDWVAEQTNGEITDLLSPNAITSQTRLVLTNAIYYQARWNHPFDEAETANRPFTALDGTITKVPMMHREGKYAYASIDGHQLVEIPYANQQTSMVIILPAEGEYEAFVESFTVDRLAVMLQEARTALVDLTLSKFGIESKASLVKMLSALGMADAFTAGADFSGMVEGGGVWLGDVVHQAAIEVDELGTKAVGATAALIEESLPQRQPELTIDRPFLFYIRDRPTETPLFFGHIINVPESNAGV